MNSEKGRALHSQAEHAREKQQDFIKSLTLLDQAILAYQQDGDPRGLSEALQSKSSAWKHIAQKTGDRTFLVLAKHDSLAGVEIAESLEDKSGIAMAYRGLAKIFDELEIWDDAKKFFSKALEAFDACPPRENNRPAVRSDMKAHLSFASYMSGDKSAITLMNEAIDELAADTEEDRYNRDVWLSGAHMRTARMLKQENTQIARDHLGVARRIIESNKELVLRKQQLQKLEEEFK